MFVSDCDKAQQPFAPVKLKKCCLAASWRLTDNITLTTAKMLGSTLAEV